MNADEKKAQLSDLKRQRGALKGRLTLFEKYIIKLDAAVITETQKAELELRMQSAMDIFKEFSNIQDKMSVLITDSELQSHLDYQETTEEQYYSHIAIGKCLLNNIEKINPKCNHLGANVKLPEIKLPMFDGSYDKWLEFRNSYLTMIHKRTDLDSIQKFQYLKSSLNNEAWNVISALEFTASNYNHAWELLENRFHNDRLLVHNHVKSLFNMTSIPKESPLHIRKLIDTVMRNLRALKTLQEPTEHWDTLLIYLITTKLDSTTEREWENHKGVISSERSDTKSKLKLDDLLSFLKNRADTLEMITLNNSAQSRNVTQLNSKQYNINNNKSQFVHTYITSTPNKSDKRTERRIKICVMCKSDHALFTCSRFVNLTVPDRLKLVDDHKLCRNCLRAGHSANDCYYGPCKQCQRKHNSLLHLDEYIPGFDKPNIRKNEHSQLERKNTNSTTLHTTLKGSESLTPPRDHLDASRQQLQSVLLSTALVEVADVNNEFHLVRALLDNGSQHSIVTDKLCNRLKIPTLQSTIRISGVGQSVTQSNHICDILMRSKTCDYEERIQCLVLPNITSNHFNVNVDFASVQLPKNIRLADSTYNEPSEIDLLLGANIFWELLGDKKIRLSSGPFLIFSKLGWLLSGPVHINTYKFEKKSHCHFDETLNEQLRKFWELENVPINQNFLTADEQKCEEIFEKTTKREQNGRFSVCMPLKESPKKLGDSYSTAKKQFLSLERRFEKSPIYKQMYCDFMREYIDLGHMSKTSTCSQTNYFLPHHGVIRESSTTTKLRTVFNASEPTTSKLSLNDIQYIGPKLQNDIVSILLRFRQYRYVACADVEKMYRQILIQPQQRDLQMILWRENPSEPLDTYQLNTVTYGTASAPFLSIRCLHQLAKECKDDVIQRVITQDFYVDDLITGDDDCNILLNICEKTSQVLSSGCFPLRKWTFNFKPEIITTKDLSIGEHTQSKTLGLGWRNDSDELYYTTKLDNINVSQLTKRKMLSVISQIYDPLGLLAPVTIISKTILQKLWLSKISWDDLVPIEYIEQFKKLINSFQYLNDLSIPRFVRSEHTHHTELHIFTDASQTAYGACAYVRTYDSTSKITVKLLCAKSKVAPLKPISVPRLELCGALIGARLYKTIVDSLRLNFDRVYFWSDSTIVLGWLRTSPHLLKTFVQNRVTEINELTGDKPWLHVISSNNPADLLSRGLYLDTLIKSFLWWEGPPYLKNKDSDLLQSIVDTNYKNLPELKGQATTMVCINKNDLFDFDKFSSFLKLKRVCAYVLRFITNIRDSAAGRSRRQTGFLSVGELNKALYILARIAQIQSFGTIYSSLRDNVQIKSKNNTEMNKLIGLNVFMDSNMLIRVGGRLTNSSAFNFDKKHPILLCSKHRFTVLLFIYEHKRLLHAGPQLLVSNLRECWWPIGGRNLAKKTVHQCVSCTRMKGKTLAPIMGNLPPERLESSFPFMRTGVDFAGPVSILNRKGRGASLTKGYICLFICFATKCIHLELVSGMSTNDYVLSLKRFISRRGKPAEIFSDNGKNFVGAEKEFPLLVHNNSQQIIDYTANEGIKFTFIPPSAAHFGGLWEAGIKSCKHHLRRVVGNSRLTYEEFSTVLVQIEAVLNSRPLYALSSDPNDLMPLTPAHFLIGRPLTSPANEDLTATFTNRLTRYARIEQLRQHFWQRWAKEYVSELQQRTKWKEHKNDIVLNSFVLIKDDNQPPLKWRLGRVVQLFPGNDGVSRVAEIRTATGLLRRAFSKICPLPVQPSCDES